MMKVLVACEYSQTVTKAFRDRGHEAYSCDILPTKGNPKWHFQKNALDILRIYSKWDLLIAHPPCTYLCNSGVSHLYNKDGTNNSERWENMRKGAEFFKSFLSFNVNRVCVENPIPHRYAKAIIGPYTQIIQPWQFGHKATKATCLWLHNLPELKPTKVVGPPPKHMTAREKSQWHEIHYMSGPDRGLKRSVTYQGIADAMAEQWGEI